MKRVVSLLLLLGHLIVQGQTMDDFNDNDLTVAPVWNVASNTFSNVLGVLRSSSTLANSQFGLSTFAKIDTNWLWSVNVKMLFNPSSLNYIDVFLQSDSIALTHTKNGYFVRLGNSSDDVSFYQLSNGVERKLIDGLDGVLNSSQSNLRLELLYEHDSFQLSYINLKTGLRHLEGKVKFSPNWQLNQVGIRIRQSTSSFFAKHVFDDFYVGPIQKDTLPPQITRWQIRQANAIDLYFNEAIDSQSLSFNQCQYQQQTPNKQSQLLSDSCIRLFFNDSFMANQTLAIKIAGIKDFTGNQIDTTINIYRWLFAKANLHDIIFSELMIDPEPSQGLTVKEYIEIYNHSMYPICLNDWTISDPSTTLVLSQDTIMPKSYHVLSVNPSLNNAADEIYLSDPNGILLDAVKYTDAWYHDANAQKGGFSLERIDLNQFCKGEGNWSASIANNGGTPNAENSIAKNQVDTVAPKLLSYDCSSQGEVSLLFNECVDSNQVLNLVNANRNYAISSFKLQTNGLKFYLPFQLKLDTVYSLVLKSISDCQGNRSHAFQFNIRVLSAPKPQSVQINEVLFNPLPNQVDFIELYNRSNYPVDLKQLFIANLTPDGLWDQIYPCASGQQLFYPGAYAIVTSDTTKLCQQYACGPNALKLQLPKLPPMPDDATRLVLVNSASTTIDSMAYNSAWHFKWLNSVEGISLERLAENMSGTEQNTWHSCSSLEGGASPGKVNSQITIATHSDRYFSVSSMALSPLSNGQTGVCLIHYALPETDAVIALDVFSIDGSWLKSVIPATHIGVEGDLVWDATDAYNQPCVPGVYILLVQGKLPSGKMIKEKLCVVVSGQYAY
jgi:hypothetical protein